jgi:tripartite-type tricarboxylate transporter receptor subunit TctC
LILFCPDFGAPPSRLLGQQVIVENVAGAGGMVGVSRVARAAPDGYQIAFGTVGTHSYNQTFYKKPLYDAATDFISVIMTNDSPLVLVTRKELPVNTLTEFISYAKLNHARLQFGSAGTGSSTHLACEMLNVEIGINITHVPYRSGAQVMQDLITDRINYHCGNVGIVQPHVESKAAKAIAIVTRDRSTLIPNVATAREQGLINLEASNWAALFVARNTPPAIVQKTSQCHRCGSRNTFGT